MDVRIDQGPTMIFFRFPKKIFSRFIYSKKKPKFDLIFKNIFVVTFALKTLECKISNLSGPNLR